MSSELDRLLRRGREVLPEPDPATTERARGQAQAAVRHRRGRRFRIAATAGVALLVVAALGIGLGAALAPSGEASKGSVRTRGLGFLPEPGWYSLQAPTVSPADRPTVAMVANVPFSPEDAVNGLAEPSALPYATLLSLPPHGIVIVASFIARSGETGTFLRYPARELPLRLRTATPFIEPGTQIRPDEPLGQYQLRAAVRGQHVDLQVYFGVHQPGPKRFAQAQRQLDRLVVRPASASAAVPAARPASPATPSGPAVIDRTVSCTTSPSGGIWEVEARASAGTREGGDWHRLPFAAASSGNVGSVMLALDDSLAWISAGKPEVYTTMDVDFRNSFVREWGTLAVSRTLCRTSRGDVPLGHAGLRNAAPSQFGEKLDCAAPRRVLVRVRALAAAPTTLRGRGGFLRTSTPMKSARLAVTTLKGKPLVYADVADSGKAHLFTANGCTFD